MSAEPDGYQETLTERLARGRLPVAEALRYAAQIADCLRHLHAQRLVYGAVSSQLILLGPAGATLRRSGMARLGDGRCDVSGFGAVLDEMLRNIEGPEDLLIEMGHLAMHCQTDSPRMLRVLITLRLLELRVRQSAVVRRPVLTQSRKAMPRRRAAG